MSLDIGFCQSKVTLVVPLSLSVIPHCPFNVIFARCHGSVSTADSHRP